MFFKKFFKKAQGKKITTAFIDGLIADMVEIPGGSFLMGSNDGEDDERPIHNVLVAPFRLGKHVVTQKEWYDVMGTKPWEHGRYVCESDRCPAVDVSWYDAKDYIEALNDASEKKFRLPTEAEWEYACSAGSPAAFPLGVLKFNLPRYAWYYENAFHKGERYAHEVGQLKANRWGLYDMQGNVYEWCEDWFRRNYYNKSPVNNPTGPMWGTYKSVRGGDWARTDYFLRIASRGHYSPHTQDVNIGFRLAMSMEDNHVSNR